MPAFAGHPTGRADFPHPALGQKHPAPRRQQAERERVLRASRRRGVRSVDSGWTGCGIDSRNRHVAEAELAPAPAKAAHRVSSSERPDAPPEAWTTSRLRAHSGTYETHQRPSTVYGGGGERGTTIVRRIADGSRTAPYYR